MLAKQIKHQLLIGATQMLAKQIEQRQFTTLVTRGYIMICIKNIGS